MNARKWNCGISGWASSKEDIFEFLNSLDNLEFEYVNIHYFDSEHNREMFHRLSTCRKSCGCTGFSPKTDCPDKKCFCNKDKKV